MRFGLRPEDLRPPIPAPAHQRLNLGQAAGEKRVPIGTAGGQVRETRDSATHGLSDGACEGVRALPPRRNLPEAKQAGFEALD
jgi:hypothetical protein